MFDKRRGYFWKDRLAEGPSLSRGAPEKVIRVEEIHALQLISEHVSGNKSSYYSYELNVVRKDGRRLNVVDHGNREKLREDAKRLAGFVGVPVWDAAG